MDGQEDQEATCGGEEVVGVGKGHILYPKEVQFFRNGLKKFGVVQESAQGEEPGEVEQSQPDIDERGQGFDAQKLVEAGFQVINCNSLASFATRQN